MFWKFSLLTASQIDTLLDQEEVKKGSVTLEDILNEDDVLQECKGQNKKLLDFLARPENMEQLVTFVIQEPDDEKDEKVRFKYPNTACELLTSDVPVITDKLADEEGLLEKVYTFLETQEPLNPLQASFFGKIMGLLITRKSELMLKFLKSRDDFVGHLIHHIGTSAIMDLLLRLITCIENTETRNECINWLSEQSIIQKLVGLIDPANTEEKHCNASQILCDIIRIGRDQMSHLQEKADNDPLLSAIESQEVVSELLNHMFSCETKVESVLVNGLQVIQTLLEFRKSNYLYANGPDGCQEQLTTLDTERLAHGVNNTLAAVSPRLRHLHELLVTPPKQHYYAMPTTMGCLDPPLGNTRLQAVRLITSLLTTNTHSVNQELANLGTIAVIIELFFKYSFNNFLHTQVEQCLCTVLNMSPSELDSQRVHPLLDTLLRDLNFLEKILDIWDDHSSNQNRPGVHRPGFMGHLTRIANSINECLEKGTNADRIKDLFKGLPEDLRQRWESFISGTLADVNKTNTVDLVSNTIDRSSSDSEDPDFSHIPFAQESAMQQAFSDYQLQQMTSTFIDQFGFNEEEFTEPEDSSVNAAFAGKISGLNFDINPDDASNAATLFEQACNERMQQFDDPDSDEDLWEDKEVTFSKSPAGRTSSPNQNSGLKQLSTSRDSDSEEDEHNSEASTDSDEELNSPRRIYQVPSTTTSAASTVTTTTTTTSSTGDRQLENMDVDSSEAWPELPKSEANATNPVDMETGASPWEQGQSPPAEQKEASENRGENWAKFDQIFKEDEKEEKTTASDSKEAEGEGKETWADFTKFEDMESANETKVAPSETKEIRSVSPVAMDTNETQSSANSRMAQYLVNSENTADNSLKDEEDTNMSPPNTPRQAWNTPRETSSVHSQSPTVPAETISQSTESGEATGAADSLEESPAAAEDKESTEDTKVASPPTDGSTEQPQQKFLSGSGLMRSSTKSTDSETDSESTKKDTEIKSNENEILSKQTEESNEEKKKVEEIRAQAQEALEEFATSTGKKATQNGPV